MNESKISSKNQVTIPKKVMQALGLSPHDRIVFQEDQGTYTIRPKNQTLAQARSQFPRKGQKALGPEEMQDAIHQGGES